MAGHLDKFVAGVVAHERWKLEDPRKSRSAYRKLTAARESLRAEGRDGEAALMTLLDHPNLSVRTWAAMYLLPSNESAALAVLDTIGGGDDIIAFGASITAREWRAGRLKAS